LQTKGTVPHAAQGPVRTPEEVLRKNQQLGQSRSQEVDQAIAKKQNAW